MVSHPAPYFEVRGTIGAGSLYLEGGGGRVARRMRRGGGGGGGGAAADSTTACGTHSSAKRDVSITWSTGVSSRSLKTSGKGGREVQHGGAQKGASVQTNRSRIIYDRDFDNLFPQF